MVPPVRLERTTRGLKVRCCYQLSYGGDSDATTACAKLCTRVLSRSQVADVSAGRRMT